MKGQDKTHGLAELAEFSAMNTLPKLWPKTASVGRELSTKAFMGQSVIVGASME